MKITKYFEIMKNVYQEVFGQTPELQVKVYVYSQFVRKENITLGIISCQEDGWYYP